MFKKSPMLYFQPRGGSVNIESSVTTKRVQAELDMTVFLDKTSRRRGGTVPGACIARTMRAIGLLAAVVVAGSQAEWIRAQEESSAGLIAFAGPDGNIWTIQADDGSPNQITHDGTA